MSDPVLTVTIPGKPRGQGSLSLWTGRDGKERARYADEVVRHRNLMVGMLRDAWAGRAPLPGPVAVRVTATFKRPKGHYGTGRNSALLKDSAPEFYCGFPDGDKILRMCADSVTIAGVIEDDSNMVRALTIKQWSDVSATSVEVWDLL